MHGATPPPDDDDAEDTPRGEGARMFDVLNALRCLPAATLDPTARYVLLVLVSHMSPTPRPRKKQPAWSAYPSGLRLALETGLSRSTVHAALTRITDAGLIARLGKAKDILAPSENGRDPESILYGLNTPFVMTLAAKGKAEQKRILAAEKVARKAARKTGRMQRTAFDDFAVSDHRTPTFHDAERGTVSDRRTPEVSDHRTRTDLREQTNLCNEGRNTFQGLETRARAPEEPRGAERETRPGDLDDMGGAAGAAATGKGSGVLGKAATEMGASFAAYYSAKARAKGGGDAP